MEVEQQWTQEWKSRPDLIEESEKSSTCFDCCICLDNASDPVVTFCGHLYCWPCIYKWLQFQGSSLSSGGSAQCPVCKAEISHTSVVPLYGRGHNVSESELDDKAASLHAIIPPRPTAFASRSESASLSGGQHLHYETPYRNMHTFEYPNTNTPYAESSSTPLLSPVCHPVVGMFGEMIYARVFGNPRSLYEYPNSYYSAGSSSSRLRRQEIETHKSLNRVSFFFFCCLLLCLLLF